MSDLSGYKNIFKTTFLFGFVQVFNIFVKVGINKVVAILLGTAGMGVISLFQYAVSFLSVSCGLGINQSSIRDISEARERGENNRIDLTISFVKSIIRYTSLFGVVVTICLSPVLSRWTFGNGNYTWSYIALSLVTGGVILIQGYRAINTGMRQLRNMALSNLWGSAIGLLAALPFYYYLGDKGIVPSLIVSTFATLAISKFYADKVKYNRVSLTFKETLLKSSGTIKMGISLMLMNMMLTLSSLVLSGYISMHGGVETVGIYQAGATIVVSYFAVIISAMSTEYYPRICGINDDDARLAQAVNAQSETGLIIGLPLIVSFVFLVPYFLRILYSDAFLSASQYTDFAIIGSIAIICSNCMGMVLLAKQNSRLFLISSFVCCFVILGLNILLYNIWGLIGLGIGYAVNGLVQLVMYQCIMSKRYGISFDRSVVLNLVLAIAACFLAKYFRSIEMGWLQWTLGGLLFVSCSGYTLWYMGAKMDINILSYINRRLKKNNKEKLN